MKFDPFTGQMVPDEQDQLNAQFSQFAPATSPPALGATVPTVQPPMGVPPLLPTVPVPPPPEALPAPLPPPPEPLPPPTAAAPPPRPSVHGGGGGGGGGPSEGRLQGELAHIQAGQEGLAVQKGNLGVQRAGEEQTIADQAVTQAQEAERRRAELEQNTNALIARKQAELDAKAEQYSRMGFKDFWSDKTTGARVLGAISMMLGAASSSLGHHPNYAMEIIDKAIDRDYQIQKDNILKAKDSVTEARYGVEAARLAKADKLADLKNWQASAHEQALAQTKAMLAKMGVPEAEIEKNALVVDQQAKAFATRQDLSKGVATLQNIRAETDLKRAEAAKARAAAAAAGSAGQEDKGRAAGKQIELATMGSQMQDDLKVIDKSAPLSPATLATIQANESALKTVEGSHGVKALVGTLAGRAAGIVPKNRLEGIPAEQQKVVNSWDLLAKKAATVLSGQGHANVESTMAMMMPRAEDSPQIIQQKLENLRHIAENATVLSGKYGQRLQAADEARAPAVAPTQTRQLDTVTRARLLERLRANPNDPRAGEVRALLGM